MSNGVQRWGTLAEVADAYGVSVDTIRRRMKRGELEARRQQTPQGFRWLAVMPELAPAGTAQQALGSPQTDATIDHGSMVVYGPDPRDTLIETLQRELELRNREVSRLHDVIGQQALAIDHATAVLSAGTSITPPPASSTDPPTRQGFWAWLLGK